MARILLADDDETVRDLVERVLAAAGHDVRVAQDGQEALGLADSGGTFDLLVTDVHMPGIDGITLAKTLAAKQPGLKVLLLSGFPEQLQRGKAELTGRIETLMKPCSVEDIRAKIMALAD
jgi:two-component system, cell cycle response regulator CpdR